MTEQKLKLERKGECNNCGWCCQFLVIHRMTVPVEDVTPDSENFYAMRNGNKGPDGKIRFVTHGFAPCSAHDAPAARCKVYDARPEVCRLFPQVPEQIEGTPCSYWFEAVDEDGNVRERRGGLDSPHPTPPRFKG